MSTLSRVTVGPVNNLPDFFDRSPPSTQTDILIEPSQLLSTHHEPQITRESNGADLGMGLGLNVANNSSSKGVSSLLSSKPASRVDIRMEPSQPQPAHHASLIARETSRMAGNSPEVLYPSRLNRENHPETYVIADSWAITLIRAAKRNHSQLVIEGVENNQQFLRVAHFGGVSGDLGRVKYSDVDPQKLKIGAQDNTHSIPRERMQVMIDRIVHERDDSAREKVRNAQGQIQEQDLVPKTNRRYPCLYYVLGYDSAHAVPSVYVEGEGIKRISVTKCWAQPSKTWQGLFNGEDLRDTYYNEAQKLADMWSASGKRAVILDPDNCISWATEKMQMLGIPVPLTNLGGFANVPQLGTNETSWKIIPTAIAAWLSSKFGSSSKSSSSSK